MVFFWVFSLSTQSTFAAFVWKDPLVKQLVSRRTVQVAVRGRRSSLDEEIKSLRNTKTVREAIKPSPVV